MNTIESINQSGTQSTITYFKHDVTALSDPLLSELVEDEGMKGVGLFWCLIEFLGGSPNYRCNLKALNNLRRRLRVRPQYMMHILTDYNLFVVENDTVSSPKLEEMLQAYTATVARSQQNSTNKAKTIKASAEQTVSECTASAEQTVSECAASAEQTVSECTASAEQTVSECAVESPSQNASKTSLTDCKALGINSLEEGSTDQPQGAPFNKKENKKENKKKNKSSSGEENKNKEDHHHSIEFHPEALTKVTGMQDSEVKKESGGYKKLWEHCIDQLMQEHSWQEIVAMQIKYTPKRFAECFPHMLTHFKRHVQAQGREDNLISVSEAKNYFSNCYRSKSPVLKAFEAAYSKSSAHSETFLQLDPYRFEDPGSGPGHRYYNGMALPENTPPRPSKDTMWDFNLNIWR